MLTSHTRKLRATRIETNVEVQILTRPKMMRSYSFWTTLKNISSTGMLIVSKEKGLLVPYKVGDVLDSTLDLSAEVFSRPLSVSLLVRRVGVGEDGCQFFGVSFEQIDQRSLEEFELGLKKLGNHGAME